jgi:hypothetical protein
LTTTINEFFSSENLTLPPGTTWQNISASVFSVVDGKRLLFEGDNALFHQLENANPSVKVPREQVALSMLLDEIHEDVRKVMKRLADFVSET